MRLAPRQARPGAAARGRAAQTSGLDISPCDEDGVARSSRWPRHGGSGAGSLGPPPAVRWRTRSHRATELSRLHTPVVGTRTLDVLHVASAVELGCRTLITYDERQAALARAVKLRVLRPFKSDWPAGQV